MKEFLFSLGVLFGLISGFTEPEIDALLFRDQEQLHLSLLLENSDNNKIRELVESGNQLVIKIDVLLKGHSSIKFTHEIFYNPIKGVYRIYQSESQESFSTVNSKAAFLLWTQFRNLPLWHIDQLKNGPVIMIITADLELSQEGEADPGLLWNYSRPQKIIRYESVEEISF